MSTDLNHPLILHNKRYIQCSRYVHQDAVDDRPASMPCSVQWIDSSYHCAEFKKRWTKCYEVWNNARRSEGSQIKYNKSSVNSARSRYVLLITKGTAIMHCHGEKGIIPHQCSHHLVSNDAQMIDIDGAVGSQTILRWKWMIWTRKERWWRERERVSVSIPNGFTSSYSVERWCKKWSSW